jgi:hypothetical protein
VLFIFAHLFFARIVAVYLKRIIVFYSRITNKGAIRHKENNRTAMVTNIKTETDFISVFLLVLLDRIYG